MKITTRQIAAIAKHSRTTCAPNGMGSKIYVYADGATEERTDYTIGGRKIGQQFEYPVLVLSYPSTRAQVAEMIAAEGNRRG